MNSDVPICTFYLKNACERGRSCSFSHQRPVFGQKSSQTICRYFLQGNCAYGEKCSRSHEAKRRTKSASSSSGISDGKKRHPKSRVEDLSPDDEQESEHSEVAPDHEREEEAQWDSGHPQPSEETIDPFDQPEKLKSPCMFYSQGLCGKGHECEFSHSDPLGAETSKSSYHDQARSSNRAPTPKKTCKLYQRGQCHMGNECKFEHVLSGQGSSKKASSLPSAPSVDPPFSNSMSTEIDAKEKDTTQHDNIAQEGNHADSYDEDIGYVSSQHENDFEPPNPPQTQRQDWADDPPQHDDSEWKNEIQPDRSSPGGEGVPEVKVDYPVNEQPKSEASRRPRKSKGPGSYYGDGWEEREIASSPSPPPPQQKRLQQRTNERVNLAPMMYPHVSEVQPHWSQFADPLANSKTPFCKPHAQGQCMQGESCRFRHSLTPTEYTILFQDQQPNLWTLERDPDAAGQPHRRTLQQPNPISTFPGEQLESVSQAPNSSSGQPVKPSLVKECVFYPLGKCRNGDKCPYRHVGPPPEAPDTAPLNSDQDWGAAGETNLDQVKINRQCRYFVSRGYCNLGDSCKFLHGDTANGNHPSSGASGPESSPEPANEENDNGWGTSWEDNNNKEDDGWGTTHGASADANVNVWTTAVDHSGWGDVNDSKEKTSSTVTRSKPKPPCRQFAQHGRCSYGDRCNFSHDAEPKEQASRHDSKAVDKEEWPPTDSSSHSAPWVVSPTPCPYFAKGSCRKGTACTLLHDPLQTPQDIDEGNENHRDKEDHIEAPPAQEQSEIIDDNNDTWAKSWPAEPQISETRQAKINAPCKAFGQGYCMYKDEECHYLHINAESGHSKEEFSEPIQTPSDGETPFDVQADDPVEASASSSSAAPVPDQEQVPEEKEPDLDPIIFDHPKVTQFMMNCEVTFGGDSTPNEVKTASDTEKLILSNLPLDVSPTDIERLATPYGEVRNLMSIDETADSTTIQVEFATVSQVVEAFQHLNGQTFQSRVILASLGGRTPLITRSPNQKLVLKVSWPNASVSAWSHYQTISKAKSEAARLNDVIVRGRTIKATFVAPPKIQRDSFAIKIDRLPVDATKAEVEELCKDNTFVSINRPTYSGEPIDDIRTSLAEFGEEDSFDILPGSDSRATSAAFVGFKNEAMAEAVINSLDRRNQEFLGQQPLTIRPVHYSRYRIFLDQFEASKNELDRLIEKCEKKCTIQFSDHRRDKNIRYVRIYAPFEYGDVFADINAKLWKLLRGNVLQNGDGCDVWDDYFDLPSTAKKLQMLTTNAFIHCDHRTKQVRLYGSQVDCEEAQNSIFRTLSKVHAQRHEIDLPRLKLQSLVNGVFTTLQTDIGINKVTLDLVNSKLVVRGLPGDISKANTTLDSLNPRPEPLSNLEMCQICHHAPVNAITLSCHHKYCTLCLQFAIRQTGHAPIPCIFRHELSNGGHKQCSAYVPYVIIRDILAAEERDILHSSLLTHVRSRPDDLFFCPSLNCKAAYRVGGEGINLKCNLCLSEICTHCKTFAHTGLTCMDVIR